MADGAAVELQANQSFFVVTTLQTPSRGKWQQAQNTSTPPAANGYADAGSTLRVTIDPQAPPEVVQQFLAAVEPECTDCEFEPDFRIDIKPGSSDNPVSRTNAGAIPVAIFSGDNASVSDIDIATLRLGALVREPKQTRRRSAASRTSTSTASPISYASSGTMQELDGRPDRRPS